MTIYLLTSDTGKRFCYTSISAFLECQLNPICVSNRQWSNLCKGGYPVKYAGWEVDKMEARTGKQVWADNTQFL